MSGERSIRLRGHSCVVSSLVCARSAAMLMLGLLAAVAWMIAVRRLAGVLVYPLEPHWLLLAGFLTAAVAATIRFAWRATTQGSFDRLVMTGTSLAVAALAFGLCLPGTSLVGMALFCTLLGAEESWAWASYLGRESPVSSVIPVMSWQDPDLGDLPENITQQLTRRQTAEGVEEISGLLRTAFTTGQRTANVHVAFCPPFAITPELEVEQVDGPEARVKTAQLLPHGVRLDLKLAAVAEEPASVVLQFVARMG